MKFNSQYLNRGRTKTVLASNSYILEVPLQQSSTSVVNLERMISTTIDKFWEMDMSAAMYVNKFAEYITFSPDIEMLDEYASYFGYDHGMFIIQFEVGAGGALIWNLKIMMIDTVSRNTGSGYIVNTGISFMHNSGHNEIMLLSV